jgi:hypothetical protein
VVTAVADASAVGVASSAASSAGTSSARRAFDPVLGNIRTNEHIGVIDEMNIIIIEVDAGVCLVLELISALCTEKDDKGGKSAYGFSGNAYQKLP